MYAGLFYDDDAQIVHFWAKVNIPALWCTFQNPNQKLDYGHQVSKCVFASWSAQGI